MLIYCIVLIFIVNSIQAANDEIVDNKRFASYLDGGSEIFYQGICLNSESLQMKIQCKSNDKIKILRTVYGYNPAASYSPGVDSCTFSIKDCHFDKEYSIDNECTGRNTCQITINKSTVNNEAKTYNQGCKDFNYVQINYQCLPNLPTKDICSNTHSDLSHAYITTPGFPNKIPPGSSCECTLTSNYENGQILLRRVDMKLPDHHENEQCSNAYLEVLENNKGSERKCGYVREAGSIYGSGATKLKLTFVANKKETWNDKGFWLEVIANPPKENHKIEIRCNNALANNAAIIKKLKLIEEKLRNKLNNTSVKNAKSKKLDGNSTTISMKTKKSTVSIKNNKTTKYSKTATSTTTTTIKTTTNTVELISDEYMMAEDFLNKELSELEMSEEYANLDEKSFDDDTKENEKGQVENNQKNSGRTLDNKQGGNNFKPINKNADQEWNKALGVDHQDHSNNNNNKDNNKDKDLMPAFLPAEGQNLGNNQLAQFNARNAGAAAQKQDLNRKDPESATGSNTAVFVGIGISVALIAVIVNAAMCYSCYKKRDAIQRYKDALMKKRRFQLKLPENINTLKFSELGHVIGKLPARFKEYISFKFNRYNQEDTYDDLSCGSIAASSSTISRGDKLNEPIVYNSGADTLYNASILSDSASNFPPTAFPPPPPPPPPPPRHHDNDVYDDGTVCHYSEFYDQFGGAYSAEVDHGHKFFKKQGSKNVINKYTNKKQKQFRLNY